MGAVAINIVEYGKRRANRGRSSSSKEQRTHEYSSIDNSENANLGKSISSDYVKTYTSYSGHDMVCVFEIPTRAGGSISSVVGSVQTISYSIHNEKMPVRVLGNMNPKGYVFGNRTIAGTIIFTVFDRHWTHKLLGEYLENIKSDAHVLTDEMPPINITIAMANEYGSKSRLALYGVTFVNEGQVMSINYMYTENTYQFYAMDIDYMSASTGSNRGGQKRKNLQQARQQDTIDELNKGQIDNSTTDVKTPSQERFETEWKDSQQVYGKFGDLMLKSDATKKQLTEYANEEYRLKSNRLNEAYKNKQISKQEYRQQKQANKEEWKNYKKQVDNKFSKKKEG